MRPREHRASTYAAIVLVLSCAGSLARDSRAADRDAGAAATNAAARSGSMARRTLFSELGEYLQERKSWRAWSLAAQDGRCPEGLWDLVHHRATRTRHAALDAWERGVPFAFEEPPVTLTSLAA